jgi:GNAT superfamily N-acetyltransferase
VLLRPATKDDRGFIAETFVRSIREVSTQVEGLADSQVSGLLDGLLARGWLAYVAEEERIIGWSVTGPSRQMLAWVYVRDLHRREGVARWLLGKIGIDTKRTIVSPFLANRGPRIWKVAQRPFLCVP